MTGGYDLMQILGEVPLVYQPRPDVGVIRTQGGPFSFDNGLVVNLARDDLAVVIL